MMVRHHGSRRTPVFVRRFARPAPGRKGQGIQTARRDLFVAILAEAVLARREPIQRALNLLEGFSLQRDEGEIEVVDNVGQRGLVQMGSLCRRLARTPDSLAHGAADRIALPLEALPQTAVAMSVAIVG